jgi:hypothetical protein
VKAACGFRGCLAPGRTGRLAGHAVALCPRHVTAVEAALQQPERFEVRWGEWGREVIARRERRLGELRARLEQLPDDEDNWTFEVTERERTQWAIDRAELKLEGMHPDSPPIMTIRERTRYVAE